MTLGWFRKKDGKTASPSGPSQASSATPAGLSNSVRLGKILKEDLVLWLPAGKSKEQLIEILVERLCKEKKLSEPKRYLSRILEREQGMSTTLDTGLSIPHARIEDLESIAAVLGLIPEGLTDPKQPDIVIRAMCVFFSPLRQEVFQQHLYLLRGVSALFQPAFIDDLLKKKTPGEVIAYIEGRESA
jgi:PTS system nitrogen regulatory IIA component